MGEHIERFVPVGKASLVDDAPGWGGETTPESIHSGPICWKCRGSGRLIAKRRRKDHHLAEEASPSTPAECSVCQGKGHLPAKKQEVLALQNRRGEITRVRACSSGWKPKGPLPWALQSNPERTANQNEAARLVILAETWRDEVPVILPDDNDDNTTTKKKKEESKFHSSEPLPPWLPQQGEQLCNLVGSWRILQRVASHRWTTDDLVTSYMAGRVLGKTLLLQPTPKPFRYLDLGCGNGSVLLMTTWQLCNWISLTTENSNPENDTILRTNLTCTGIEARQEAVNLARRSIAFNVGETVDVRVHHGDFRSVLDELITEPSHCYDLVTGTPPYFRVDFTVEKSNESVVVQAVIQQGGMPTCKQSAPARCEFRGGVEAYCKAAATAMHQESYFCVCENWLNNERVYQGAADAGLVITEVLPVQGRVGKPCPLFAVYGMRKKEFFGDQQVPKTVILDCLSVRDEKGNWTDEYQKVLDAMSIPVVT